MKKKNPLLKVLAEQVRSLSYDIEDCLDEVMVHVGSQSLSQQLMRLKDHHKIAIKIRNLKSRVEEVRRRNTCYNLINIEDINIDEVHSSLEDVHNHLATIELVGFDTTKRELLCMINTQGNDGCIQVICVVGMGGLGKTSLVRKIYESKEDIVKNYSCFAWITISQSFSKKEMLKDGQDKPPRRSARATWAASTTNPSLLPPTSQLPPRRHRSGLPAQRVWPVGMAAALWRSAARCGGDPPLSIGLVAAGQGVWWCTPASVLLREGGCRLLGAACGMAASPSRSGVDSRP
jgi:hypothetical protein